MTTKNSNISPFFVYLIIFICGSVLMSLEISGSRVLAPYFGNSIFVWASLISVLLGALACGYFWGGKLADNNPSITLWGKIIGLAGIFILLVPLLSGPTCRFISQFNIGDRTGSLLATCCLFFLPSLMLGTVSPFAIKFILPNISVAGNVTGRIYAVSAMGNIFGTLFTAFYLITKVGIFAIFTTLGFILIVTAIVLIASKRTSSNYAISLLFALISLTLIVSPAPALLSFDSNTVIQLEKDSFYHHIVVIDDIDKNLRRLHFDKGDQTSISLLGNHESQYNYTTMYHIPIAFVPSMKNVLFIGGGGAVTPRNYANDYPNINIDVVEIDPIVAQISKDYFFLEPNERLKLNVADGRRFIQNSKTIYDIVLHDAYFTKNQIPFHLTTKEFFEEANKIMSSNGVIALNLGGSITGENNALFLAVHKTLNSVFNHVYVFPDINVYGKYDLSIQRNIILIGSKSKERLSKKQISLRLKELSDSGFVSISNFEYFAEVLQDIDPSLISKATVLTDDFAPIEYLMQ